MSAAGAVAALGIFIMSGIGNGREVSVCSAFRLFLGNSHIGNLQTDLGAPRCSEDVFVKQPGVNDGRISLLGVGNEVSNVPPCSMRYDFPSSTECSSWSVLVGVGIVSRYWLSSPLLRQIEVVGNYSDVARWSLPAVLDEKMHQRPCGDLIIAVSKLPKYFCMQQGDVGAKLTIGRLSEAHVGVQSSPQSKINKPNARSSHQRSNERPMSHSLLSQQVKLIKAASFIVLLLIGYAALRGFNWLGGVAVERGREGEAAIALAYNAGMLACAGIAATCAISFLHLWSGR